MTALFCLHQVITSLEEAVRNKHDFFFVLAIPCNNALFSSSTGIMLV
jgi:hypothetical protein